MARGLFLSAAAPRLVIDPADSDLTQVPGCVTFSDPGRRLNRSGEDWHAAATARFVPRDPDDLDAYDAVYRWAFARFPRYVWVDEAADVLPAKRTPRGASRFLQQGAKRQLGHLACSTRPREIARNLLAQALHVLIWPLPNPDDRRHVAELAGIAPAHLEQLVAELPTVAGVDGKPKSGFLWWDVAAQTITACPPIKVRR